MSPFASAIQQAQATVRAVAGVFVTYCRGDVSVTLMAVPGSTNFESGDVADTAVVNFVSSDWIFRSSELQLNGQAITPKRGDLVKVTDDLGTTRVYEVLHDGSQVYRYCDRDRTHIRVHTKEKANG